MTLESSRRGFHKSPSVTNSVVKGNEADRLVRCKHCGWICDKERDPRAPEDSWAFLGTVLGAQLTAGSAISDGVSYVAGGGAKNKDKYYNQTTQGGCPSCGSFLYDQKPSEYMDLKLP